MAVGDIYEARYVCTKGAQTALNVRHFRVTVEATTPVTAQEIANALDTAAHTRYKVVLTTAATYRGVGVKKIQPGPVGTEAFTIAHAGFGVALGDPLPTQVCGIVTLRTALAGRINRGRVYLPFPSEGNNSDGTTPDPAYMTGLADFALIWVGTTSVPTATGGPATVASVVWSRATITANPVTALIARPKWATQRKRGAYGAANSAPF